MLGGGIDGPAQDSTKAVAASILRELVLVVGPNYSDAFRETEDEGRKTALAFVFRLPSSVQVVKLARTNY